MLSEACKITLCGDCISVVLYFGWSRCVASLQGIDQYGVICISIKQASTTSSILVCIFEVRHLGLHLRVGYWPTPWKR